MFWILLLAHLIGDFPLQTDRLVQAKRNLPGLLIHVGIHLLAMLVIVVPFSPTIWPYLLAIAAFHFLLDGLKNLLARARPKWIIGPFVVDQGLHVVFLWLASAVMRQAEGSLPPTFVQHWVVFAVGFLLVTHVWHVTEHLIAYGNPDYRRELRDQYWSRMGVRALLLAAFLALGRQLTATDSVALLAIPLPYVTGSSGRRALLTDLAVALFVAVLVGLVR